ncbi:MAG TPA: S53 family peptidase [Actinocrinis sp.]|nr:S53 family peptidase [Actinocrinis sp.]
MPLVTNSTNPFVKTRSRTLAMLSTAALTGAMVLTGPIASASASTAPVANSHPAWATNSADRGAVSPGARITTTVYLAGQNQAGMAAYATAVSTPGSPSYQRYLTPAQEQAEFGATATQVKAVTAWLTAAGLTVTSSDAHSITVSGTAAQTQAAYGTAIHNYSVAGKTYYAPTTSAQVPAAVAGSVLAIGNLNNMPLKMITNTVGQETTPAVPGLSGTTAKQTTEPDGSVFLGPTPCSAYYGQIKDTTDPAINGASDSPYAVCGYTPSQMRGAYGVTSTGLTGKGVKVAVVDAYGSSTIAADANKYAVDRGDAPFKPGQFTQTVTPADWNSEDECGGAAGWAPEESLDIEAVHGMAPGADIHYYGSNSCNDVDFLSVFTSIVDTHSVDLVSNSWAGVVYSSTGNEPPTTIAEYSQLFIQGAIEGIGFDFSSGDCGAEDPATSCGVTDTSTTPQAEFPSSDPWATDVGGTSLAIGKNDQQLWNTVWGTDAWVLTDPTTWTDYGWQFGGGGGTSAVFGEPWYQKGIASKKLATTLPDGTTTTQPMRTSPDVSMDADPYTGFLIGMTQTLPDGTTGYGESDIGGTSLACPLFTGLQADVIQAQHSPTGFANPALYARYKSPAISVVTDHSAGTKAYNTLPAFQGFPPVAVNFGDDQLLKAGNGYSDANGLGTATPLYLWSYLF